MSYRGSVLVSVVSDLEGVEALEPVWNDLLARSGPDVVSLTFEWVTAWLRSLGSHVAPMVLVARHDTGEICGIAPLMVRTKVAAGRGERLVEFIGAPNSDYSDFIVTGRRDQVLRAFFDGLLERRQSWDRLSLREIPAGSESLPVIRELCRSPWFPVQLRDGEICPTLMLAGHEAEVRAELARKKFIGKRTYDKSLAYIETSLGPVTLGHSETLEAAQAALGELFRLHRHRWADTMASKFEDPAHQRFYVELVERLWPTGTVRVSTLAAGGTTLAVSVAFPRAGVWTNYSWVHDHEYGKYSAGTLLVAFLIGSALDLGLGEFDLTRGNEPYKQRFATDVKRNTDLIGYASRREFAQHRARELTESGKSKLAGSAPGVHGALRTVKSRIRSPRRRPPPAGPR